MMLRDSTLAKITSSLLTTDPSEWAQIAAAIPVIAAELRGRRWPADAAEFTGLVLREVALYGCWSQLRAVLTVLRPRDYRDVGTAW